jgi:hypothetical protein
MSVLIRNVSASGPEDAKGRTRLIAKVASGHIEVVGCVDKVGDVVNTPILLTLWDQYTIDQFNQARPRFGGLTNPRFDAYGPVASLHFDVVN